MERKQLRVLVRSPPPTEQVPRVACRERHDAARLVRDGQVPRPHSRVLSVDERAQLQGERAWG